MTGSNNIDSRKNTNPKWGLHDRTKLAWFPGRDVDFKASSSPAATKYSYAHDRPYPNKKYSVSRHQRFHIANHVKKLSKQLPHQYTSLPNGLVSTNS